MRGARPDRPGTPDLLGAAPAAAGRATLRERTRLLPRRRRGRAPRGRPAAARAGRLVIRDRGVRARARARERNRASRRAARTAARSSGRASRPASPARGTLRSTAARPRQIEALAVIDDTAGYHARDTEWRWSAGVGQRRRRARARLEPRQRRQRPAAGQRAGGVGGRRRRTRSRRSSSPPTSAAIRARRRLAAALHGRGRAQPPREPADRRSRLPRAVRHASPATLPGGDRAGRAGCGVMEHHRARW